MYPYLSPTSVPSIPRRGRTNVAQTYTLTLVTGDRRTGTATQVMNGSTAVLASPNRWTILAPSLFGNGGYAAYAANFIFPITITTPGCTAGQGKVFVGQRQDPFFLDLGVPSIWSITFIRRTAGSRFSQRSYPQLCHQFTGGL